MHFNRTILAMSVLFGDSPLLELASAFDLPSYSGISLEQHSSPVIHPESDIFSSDLSSGSCYEFDGLEFTDKPFGAPQVSASDLEFSPFCIPEDHSDSLDSLFDSLTNTDFLTMECSHDPFNLSLDDFCFLDSLDYLPVRSLNPCYSLPS